jgi:hypothetical protein
MSDLPPMTHREASWHTMLAGQRAATAPDAEARRPALEVADGAAGGIEVAGVLVPPPCAGSILVIESLSDLFKEAELKSYDQVALIVWAFVSPLDAYRLVVQTPDAEAVLAAARACLAPIPLDAVPRLRDWVLEHMAALSGRAGGLEAPQKKTEAPPAAETTSSTGSSPHPDAPPPPPEEATGW